MLSVTSECLIVVAMALLVTLVTQPIWGFDDDDFIRVYPGDRTRLVDKRGHEFRFVSLNDVQVPATDRWQVATPFEMQDAMQTIAQMGGR